MASLLTTGQRHLWRLSARIHLQVKASPRYAQRHPPPAAGLCSSLCTLPKTACTAVYIEDENQMNVHNFRDAAFGDHLGNALNDMKLASQCDMPVPVSRQLLFSKNVKCSSAFATFLFPDSMGVSALATYFMSEQQVCVSASVACFSNVSLPRNLFALWKPVMFLL